MHVYHYAGNNPVKYEDPDGRIINWVQGEDVTNGQMASIRTEADNLMNSGTEVGRRFKEINDSPNVTVTINVNLTGVSDTDATNWDNATNGDGSDSVVNININDTGNYVGESVAKDARATLAHEVSGHAYYNFKGKSPYNGNKGKGTWPDLFKYEQAAVAMENDYRSYKGLQQRQMYNGTWDMPIYNSRSNAWYVYSGILVFNKYYLRLPGPRLKWRP
jgi:hypothetical protein